MPISVSSIELRPSTLIRHSNFALRISPHSHPTKPAKTHQKPSKNPHFAPAHHASIPSPTPHPINPYIHSLPQSRVHATFFPRSHRKCPVPKCPNSATRFRRPRARRRE